MGVEHVLHRSISVGPPLEDDTPGLAGVGVVAVDLERHAASEHCGGELGALRRAEDDGAVVDDEVDRKDVRVRADSDRETPDVCRSQQFPARARSRGQ